MTMSRVERKKQNKNPAIAKESIGNPEANAEHGLQTRQSLRENKKNKKGSYPLLTALAVIFFCVPVLVWIGLRFLEVGPSPDNQLDEYEYRERGDRTSMQLPSLQNEGTEKEARTVSPGSQVA